MYAPALFGSIRVQVQLLAGLSTATALVIACVAFVLHDSQLFEEHKRQQLHTYAGVIGLNVIKNLETQDRASASEVLSSLRLEPTISAACLYNRDGKVLVTYRQADEAAQDFPLPAHDSWFEEIDDTQVALFKNLHNAAGEHVGSLYLRASREDVHLKTSANAILIAIVFGVSLIAAGLLAQRLHTAISKPIEDLQAAADKVTAEGDYSVRVHCKSGVDLTNLYSAFNAMLDRVEIADRAVQESHQDLNERVRERTQELQHEVHERRHAEAALTDAMHKATEANRAKSEFLANMSHEIRTPLNAILGYAELIQNESSHLSDDHLEHLETIATSGRHLLSLINDVLDLSKVEAGQLTIEPDRISPHLVLAGVTSLLRVRAAAKGVELTYAWETKAPVEIYADASRFRQLLMNLVGNAIKFTEQGSVQITASIEGPREESILKVEVVDTGIGIAQDKLESIFDPFVQADSSVTRRFGGTGLGLAISARIAEAMNADLSVKSEVGRGSQFILRMPIGSLKEAQLITQPVCDALVNLPREETAELPTNLRGMRVLLVEDGETNRRLISLLLRREGIEVEIAENGKQGLEAALACDFDLILMDMQMPVMDGYTAAHRLRDAGMSKPIVALTAHAMKGDKEKCLDAGCSDYLTKPIEARRLMEMLSDYRQVTTPLIASQLPTDDPDFRGVVEQFLAKTAHEIKAMQTVLHDKDWEKLKGFAHWLKGSGGTAGYPGLTTLASEFEKALKSESDVSAIEKTFAEIESYFAKLIVSNEKIEAKI